MKLPETLQEQVPVLNLFIQLKVLNDKLCDTLVDTLVEIRSHPYKNKKRRILLSFFPLDASVKMTFNFVTLFCISKK